MFKIRVKALRGTLKLWTVGQTRSKAQAQAWATSLREALIECFPGEREAGSCLQVKVTRTRKKVKR